MASFTALLTRPAIKITREIKEAVREVLKYRIDRENYGMLSSYYLNRWYTDILRKNDITITSDLCTTDKVLHKGKVIAEITYRYAAHKRDGMYKMLTPQVVYL